MDRRSKTVKECVTVKRVLIIGIDGGTFDIINPLVSQGKLPNLGSLLKEGAHGYLKTTTPPMTFPAWNAFMTGVNPGKHGVFDFTERIPGTYSIRFLNARSRKAQTIWMRASEAGKRVCVMAVPVSYPPEKVNGYMISGFDAPGVDAKANPESMHPPELFDEIKNNVGEYVISSNIIKEIEAGRPDLAMDVVLRTLNRKIETALYLYKKEPWDLFGVVFGESDLAGHHYWKLHDPNSPFRPQHVSEKCQKSIETVYMAIDKAIGNFLGNLHPDTTLMIMSDHGFGGTGDKALYPNSWLASEGFLTFKDQKQGPLGLIKARLRDYFLLKPFSLIKRYGLKWVPPEIKQMLFRHRPGLVNAIESTLRFAILDWPGTLAYSEETPYYPTIWINLKGREPGGVVEPKDREKVVGEIIEKLKSWEDPETGIPVVRQAFRREEIYHGPYLEKAPDIIIDYNEPGSYSYLYRPSFTNPERSPIRKLSAEEMNSAPFQNKSGSHRNYGIFFLYGADIVPGYVIKDAHILDIAPTAFYHLDLPIPDYFDGRVLKECFKVFDKQEYRVIEEKTDISSKEIETYSPEEEEKIRKRLEGLGYL